MVIIKCTTATRIILTSTNKREIENLIWILSSPILPIFWRYFSKFEIRTAGPILLILELNIQLYCAIVLCQNRIRLNRLRCGAHKNVFQFWIIGSLYTAASNYEIFVLRRGLKARRIDSCFNYSSPLIRHLFMWGL